MDNMVMNAGNVDTMISKMQELAAAASGGVGSPQSNKAENGTDFQSILKNAIENVNSAQNAAQAKAQSFSTGSSDTSLEEVIVSLQKANLSLQGMIAVRNRLVDAYKEVTNLQV
jgi:flagellar hook-basal body complex protein FliE